MSSISRLASLRARIELPVVRGASGLLEGRHRSIFSGHGQDFDELVEYRPGDDPKDIDWKTSARAGHPVIKRFQKETNLSMVLAVDTGRSMAALTPTGETKAEVALLLAEVIAYLARWRGDQVGLVAGDAERLQQMPPRQGTRHLELLLRQLEADMGLDAPPSDMSRVLHRVLTASARRSLIVVITDEARPGPDAEMDLRRLRTRHEVIVMAVADMRPTELLDHTGLVVDVDGGPLPQFVRHDRAIRREAEEATAARRAAVRAMLRRRGVEVGVATGTADAVDALVDLLRRQRHARH